MRWHSLGSRRRSDVMAVMNALRKTESNRFFGVSLTTRWTGCANGTGPVHFVQRWRGDICKTLQQIDINTVLYKCVMVCGFLRNKLNVYVCGKGVKRTWNIWFALSLSVEKTGESTGIWRVNLVSNCETSSWPCCLRYWIYKVCGKRLVIIVCPTSIGLIGGSNLRASTSSHLTCLKKMCALMASASSGPLPNRWATWRFMRRRSKSRAPGVRYAGNFILPRRIVSMVFLRFSAVNGGYVKEYYIN